ncbi:MAG: aminopeptidase [Erysipelotrichaceae bacterium]|nr:aminopeptidase [Erysipelotrichaceae bacterium]
MVKKETLQKYADLAVRIGANVQKDQMLVINGSVTDYQFIRMCVKSAYEAGASYVQINWSDEETALNTYLYASTETLCEVPQWNIDKTQWTQDKGAAFLHVISDTPGLMKSVDPVKMQTAQMARMKKTAHLQKYTMNNEGQWSIVALPSAGWAKIVFPDLEEDDAVNKLMDAILMSSRVSDDNDPVEEWKKHNYEVTEHSRILNEHNFKSLHFKSETGTDLTVELVKNHVWAGGCETTTKGIVFNPNIPTEENFCMPHKYGVNGKVVATKPLNYQGKLIENFWIEFKDGKAVDFGAEKEVETLKNLIEFDEGSAYLGEVALISYDSPINNTGILFYNTLFDENASCHLALGRAYPMNVKNGTSMSDEELAEAGANSSMTHVDFMFGSRDMHVTGIKENGETVTLFENGNFII